MKIRQQKLRKEEAGGSMLSSAAGTRAGHSQMSTIKSEDLTRMQIMYKQRALFQAEQGIPPTNTINEELEAEIMDYEATNRTIIEPIKDINKVEQTLVYRNKADISKLQEKVK